MARCIPTETPHHEVELALLTKAKALINLDNLQSQQAYKVSNYQILRSSVFSFLLPIFRLTALTMVYPDTFEGFQVDGAETWTTFTKREV